MALGKNKVLVIVLAVVVSLLLCCGVGMFAYMWFYMPGPLGDSIEIPDMVGMTVPEARDALSIRSRILLVENDAEPGTVVAQSHEPGSTTHHDDIVTLEVAGPIEVPDIIGMDGRAAQDLLFNAGYDSLDYRYDPDASEPDGTVISQDPEPGTETMMLDITYVIAGEDPYPDY